MCRSKTKSFYYSILVSTCLVAPNAGALDLTVPLTGSLIDVIGVVVATPYANVNINATGTFGGALTGTKIGIIDNQTINFSGVSIKKDLIALERGNLGLINNTATINVNSGIIKGNVKVTSDTALYAGVDQRATNNINFKGGSIGGNLIGGAGALKNNIIITGGTMSGNSDEEEEENKKSGTIYAGSDSASTVNKSVDASVVLRDMNSSNSFLTSFTEGASNAGTIIGSNITGKSDMNFDGVNGIFKGGFKNFDTVNFTQKSALNALTDVTLGGTTYNADVWNVSGKLNTNGKTLHTYKTANLLLNVSATGLLAQQFLSDANVTATNSGTINGIKVLGAKNILLDNIGIMTGDYIGNQVTINNNLGGTITGNTNLNSVLAGALNNLGSISANLSVSGNITINNQSGGTIDNSTVTNNQPVLTINNTGTVSNTNFVNADDTKTINFNNQANANVTGNIGIKDGTMNLNNLLNGNIHDANFTSDSAALNINNSGKIYGNNSLNSANGGTIKLQNNATGDLTGILNVNSGLNNFSNAGTIHDLTINNKINDLVLNNTNIINGNNVINNNANNVGMIINNNAGGNVSGAMNTTGGNLALNNQTGANIHDLNMMVSGNGQIMRVSNQGLMNGNNTINVTNSGTFQLTNESGGEITGILNNTNGSYITNKDGGNIHDLAFNNNQANTGITNYGTITNFSLNNMDDTKFMTLFNLGENGQGEVTGNLNVNKGKLYVASSGLIDNLNAVADNGSLLAIYNTKMASSPTATGIINGTNTFEGKNGSAIEINNLADGNITGTFNVKNGTTINNTGVIDGLITQNSQNILNVNNTGAGELRNTLTFNNSDDTKVVNLNNSSTDVLNGGLNVKDGTLNLNNANVSTVNGYAMVVDSAVLNVNNQGTISGTNSITNTNGGTSVLNNQSGGTVGGNLTVTGSTLALNNLSGATVASLDLKADGSTVSIDNQGTVSGNNILENANGGIINFVNEANGTLKDNLTVKGGVNTFSNLGTINSLNVINEQTNLTLSNSGSLLGTNTFVNSAVGNTINLNNEAGASISGVLASATGNFNLDNKIGANLSNLSYINNGAVAAITNAGTISNVNLTNNATTALDLTNTGSIVGSGIWKDVDLDNQVGGTVYFADITSKDGVVNIENSGNFNGSNTLTADNGTFTFANNSGGKITGGLTVNGGLSEIVNNSGGIISDAGIIANQANLQITNEGSITDTLMLNANNEFKIVNNGAGIVNANLNVNTPILSLEQNSSGAFNTNLLSNSANTVLNLTNSTSLTTNLNGLWDAINIVNTNPALNLPTVTVGNTGTIGGTISINNGGNTQIDNSGTTTGNINDNTSTVVPDDECPEKIVTVNNSGNMSGDVKVMNNILYFNNAASGNVTSNHIDSRDLRLTNAGNFNSDVSYLFSVRDHLNVENSGSIYGRDYAFMLTGDNVTGSIDNTGTIWSQGTTIGYDNSGLICPSCYGDTTLTLNNSGRIVAVDSTNLTIPNLDSYAIKAKNMDVVNQNGGLIGGSMELNTYNQQAGSTWVTFMDKDKTQMSTIHAQDTINIDAGSTLYIHTNNDVKAFTDGQKFKLVTADNMSQNNIETEIENYTIKTDSPFANYSMIAENHDGFITFNSVAPTQFATATDLTTANHSNTILGSHRMYELFVNRDVNRDVQGLSSGDGIQRDNSLNFMPLAGYAKQDSKDGHAGYDTNYYGGLGYYEHDFSKNLKGGLGLAYMKNDTDYSDSLKSTSKIDSYRPFAYLDYEIGNWRVDLAGGVARHNVKNNRYYSFNNTRYLAKSKYDADEISGHLNIGYKYMLNNGLVVQPMVGAYAAKLKTDKYDETGTGPMNMHVKSEDYNSLKTMLGMKFKKDYNLESGTIVSPELHVRWYHETEDTKGGVSAYFLAQEQLFNTSGIESPKDIGDIAIRLTTKSDSDWDLFTEAYYQFGSKFYNIGGTVGLKYNF